MENLDLVVLRTLRDWRMLGQRALLATVVRTWGSSPRPVGSIMAMAEDGSVVGSVSGGCIEDDLIHRYTRSYSDQTNFPSGSPRCVTYGVSADEAHRFGLPCGGTLELLLEFDTDPLQLKRLVDKLEAGQMTRRCVRLADGHVHLKEVGTPEMLYMNRVELGNTFGPAFRMLLIGAGQLSEYLATMATFSGFAVTVCDPRLEYRSSWHLPAIKILTGMPDDIVRAFRPDVRTCIIALTHDPKLDDLALLEALTTSAFYIGAIGSRRNQASRRDRLKVHFDHTDEDLERLRGPIGLYIGSKTPAEIAVSVMAEVVAVKNGVGIPEQFKVENAKNLLHFKETTAVCH